MDVEFEVEWLTDEVTRFQGELATKEAGASTADDAAFDTLEAERVTAQASFETIMEESNDLWAQALDAESSGDTD